MLRKIPFIKPMAPTLAKVPPAGPDWLHEVKFDGWRMQLHVDCKQARLYRKHGTGPTRDWLKIKTASWRAANRDRWELFDNRS